MTQDNIRVLLLDDDEDYRRAMTVTLGNVLGVVVDEAGNGREAITRVEAVGGEYDVILIDQHLGTEPDGIAVLSEIRHAWPDIECIILTGYDPDDRQRAVAAGAFRYVEKDYVAPGELILLIRGAANQARQRALGRDIMRGLERREALRRILEAVASLLEADEVVIMLRDAEEHLWERHDLHAEANDDPTRAALGDAGLAEEIHRTARPVSLGRPDDLLPGARALGMASLAATPVLGQERIIGALFAYSRHEDHFDARRVIDLQELTTYAGLALDNSRAYQKTANLAGYLSALADASVHLAKTTDVAELLRLVQQFINSELQVNTFFVALHDAQTDMVTFPVAIDKGQPVSVTPFPLAAGESLTAHVIQTGLEQYWPTREEKDAYCDRFNTTSRLLGESAHSCLFHPLKSGGRVIGALSVQAYMPHAFPVEFQVVIRALGNQLAAALENARLMGDVRRKATDLATLQELSIGIASSLQMDTVGSQTCEAAVHFFGADHSGLVLFGPDDAVGRVVAEYPSLGTLGHEVQLAGVLDEQALIQEQQPLPIERVTDRATMGVVRDLLLKLGIQSSLIVPVVAAGRLLGSFSIDFFAPRPFSEQDVDNARMFASQVAVALAHARYFEESARQGQLLDALERAARQMKGEQEPARLMHAIVRVAVELMDCRAGCLLINDAERQELEIKAVVGLPEYEMMWRIPYAGSLAGRVASAGDIVLSTDYEAEFTDPLLEHYGFQAAVGVPLLSVGEVRAVLQLFHDRKRVGSDADRNILARYGDQAAIALRTSEMMTASQRSASQVRLLHKISDRIQAADDLEDIFHMVLTGVTADFGLGFNCAAILLLEGEELVGRVGVGHFNEPQASKDWLQDQQLAMNEFAQYYTRLKNGEFREKRTPLDQAVRRLRLSGQDSGLLAEVISRRGLIHVDETEESRLPEAFRVAFQPHFPLVIAPLLSRERVIGLLVADNRFTDEPITDELSSSLRGFADTAAVAIDNARLVDQRERIWRKATAVATAVAQEDLTTTLAAIAESCREALEADVVTVYGYDSQAGGFTDLGQSIVNQHDPSSIRRPEHLPGDSVLNDIIHLEEQPYYRLHDETRQDPTLERGEFVRREGIQATVGFQLRGREEQLGVIMVNYRRPHRFDDSELTSIQLFADQAAAAIYGQKQYRNATYRARVMQALYTAAQSITSAPTLEVMLEQIARQALAVVEQTDTGAACYVALRHGDTLQIAAASSGDIMHRLRDRIGVLLLETGERVGIIGRVARTGQSEIHADAPDDPDYLEFEPGMHSELVVPIKQGEDVIGVINLEHPQEDYFRLEDQQVLESLAALATAAIQTTQHLEQKQLVAEISARVNASRELGEFLDSLFEQLVSVFRRREVSVYPNLALYEPNGEQLRMFETRFYPGAVRTPFIGLEEVGIIPLVARTQQMYYAPDVADDLHYKRLRSDTRSELAVPVFYDNRLLAVLGLESPIRNAFSGNDCELLETLAHQIATTIHNINLNEQLRQTQMAVNARTMLIHMSVATNRWGHRIRNQAQTIVDQVEMLERDLARPPAKRRRTPAERLHMITQLAEAIKRKPIEEPLDREIGVHSEQANALLQETADKLLHGWLDIGTDKPIKVSYKLGAANEDYIAVNRVWFKMVVETILENAIAYVQVPPTPQLEIGSRRVGTTVEFYFADNGPGIPADRQSLLTKEPIIKDPDEPGHGIGLFLARLVMETYQGKMRIENNKLRGTVVTLSFPCAQSL